MRSRWFVVLIAAAAPAQAEEAPTEPVALPTYRLTIGEELVYQTTDVSHVGPMKFEHKETEAVCPLGCRADGTWRLLVRWTFHIQGRTMHKLFRVDLAPTGALLKSRPDGYPEDMGLWKRLPTTRAMLDQGWEATIAGHAATYRFAGREGDLWRFRMEIGDARSDYCVDARAGRPTRIEYEAKGEVERRTRSTTFRESARRDAAWLANAERASDDYIETRAKHEFRYRGVRRDRVEASYKDANGALVALRGRVKVAEILEAIDDDVAEIEEQVQGRRENVETHAAHLDKPSPAWKLEDLDGEEHALEKYRGKVVILEFWDSGCEFCLDAMPLINALAERVRGRPVAILGMNTTDDEGDARAIVNQKRLTYPTLLEAHRVAAKYGIEAMPRFVVIDREGIVREVYCGYAPTITEDLLAVVESLLG